MMKHKEFFVTTIIMVLAVLLMGTAQLTAKSEQYPVAEVTVSSNGIYFYPVVPHNSMIVAVSKADGCVFSMTFEQGKTPYIGLTDHQGNYFEDGQYTYEIKAVQDIRNKERKREEIVCTGEEEQILSQGGSFVVYRGYIATGDEGEEKAAVMDVVHNDDVIVTGSQCIGFDCENGESFGYDTLRLEEHNLRLAFVDTSYAASYPNNDWQIRINSSQNGGTNAFFIDDLGTNSSGNANNTVSATPFTIEAGAPTNALYIEDYGRIGLGTSVPSVELHIKDSDTPTVRLEQDSSVGWTPQTWDLAGNEANFFLRDVTNGSKLSFRVQPNTPGNTLCLKSSGNVGIGTWAPAYSFEIERTGENAIIAMERTDGATGYMNAAGSNVYFGSISNHGLRLVVNSAWKLELNSDNSLDMANGASCTAAGVWTDASSIELKENIRNVTAKEAFETLDHLKPVRYNYKADKEDEYVGFIAEEVPELVAQKNRKSMSSMDVVAVLTRVVQEQQRMVNAQQKTIREQKEMTEKQQKTIDLLQKRISEIENKSK